MIQNVLENKISVLLTEGPVSNYQQETSMVSLVMMLNLSDDNLRSTFRQHKERLQPLCVQLLRSAHQDILVRVAVAVMARLDNDHGEWILNAVMASLYSRAERDDRRESNVGLLLLWSKFIGSDSCKAVDVSPFFKHVWKVYEQLAVCYPFVEEITSPDNKMMQETLKTGLSRRIGESDDLDCVVSNVFLREDLQELDWFPSCLQWVLEQPNETRRSKWHIVLFAKAHERGIAFLAKEGRSSFFDLMLSRLCLDGNDEQARRMAWFATANLIESAPQIAFEGSCSGRLGTATKFCAVLRLAAGEYRILLGRLLTEEQLEMGPATDAIEDTLVSCGRIVTRAVRLLTKDSSQSASVDLSAVEVLIHLKHSCLDVLNASVLFLNGSTDMVRRSIAESTVCRVLAVLLSDISVFDEDLQGTKTTEALQAMKVGVENTRIVEWVPCLVHVLNEIDEETDAAESSRDRAAVLQKSGLLNDCCLKAYLEWFWQSPDGLEDTAAVVWACQLSELWVALICPAKNQIAQLTRSCFNYIQTKAESAVPVEYPALLAAVGCYMVLVGDRTPTGMEAIVVGKVMNLCGTTIE
uniref:Uncharacterized protein n=1 Tax=Grammatophora oceanica TaxID=210454 RepID=A0A7S1YM49_9STRA|mmetsp:Transcript_5675/g.7974  ORF Transcript_5675/g.7974 Transcript_5675/m.7974 type:complete len:581 (+) Transcript_5675:66-1808(+)